MKGLENQVLKPQRKESDGKAAVAEKIRSIAIPTAEAPQATKIGQPSSSKPVREIDFRGDTAWLDATGLPAKIRTDFTGKPLDEAALRKRLAELQKDLVNQGYYLANLWLKQVNHETGVMVVQVDAGRVGKSTFAFHNRAGDGRYFSREQLKLRLSRSKPGQIFNYFDFYDDVYDLNDHPDLVVDTELVVESRADGDQLRRYVDLNFTVEEDLPIHGVISLNNYGTESTGEWQASATVQDLNLTHHDDVLTFSVPFSLSGDLVAAAGSYSLPYHRGQGGSLTLYGGYSTLETEDVVDAVDVNGSGWFTGFQWSHNLVDNRQTLLVGSAGLVRRRLDDRLVVEEFETDKREITVMPLSLALSYTQRQPDRLGGRNLATMQLSHNQGDFLGTSDEKEIQLQREEAKPDYLIGRLQFARVQPILGGRDEQGRPEGRWVVFGKMEVQVADGALIPAEQLAAGGARSVRGYQEREFFGDNGGLANLELRSPLLLGLFSNGLGARNPAPGAFPLDRLQAVLFADGGYTENKDSAVDQDSQTLFSVGVGIRLAVTKHAQLKVDWGFPLEETNDSDSSGYGNLELQAQF